MEGTSDAGSKVKDERSDEDEVTIVEDADEAQENGGGRSSEGTSAKKKDAVDQERSQSSNVFEYNMQSVLHVDEDMSPIESRQDSHGTNVDSDFQASMDQGLDQGGWSWNKESEIIQPDMSGTPRSFFFECEICHKRLSCKSNLGRHMKEQHSTVKHAYSCLQCLAEFRRRCDLKAHYVKRHPDDLYEADTIPYQASRFAAAFTDQQSPADFQEMIQVQRQEQQNLQSSMIVVTPNVNPFDHHASITSQDSLSPHTFTQDIGPPNSETDFLYQGTRRSQACLDSGAVQRTSDPVGIDNAKARLGRSVTQGQRNSGFSISNSPVNQMATSVISDRPSPRQIGGKNTESGAGHLQVPPGKRHRSDNTQSAVQSETDVQIVNVVGAGDLEGRHGHNTGNDREGKRNNTGQGALLEILESRFPHDMPQYPEPVDQPRTSNNKAQNKQNTPMMLNTVNENLSIGTHNEGDDSVNDIRSENQNRKCSLRKNDIPSTLKKKHGKRLKRGRYQIDVDDQQCRMLLGTISKSRTLRKKRNLYVICKQYVAAYEKRKHNASEESCTSMQTPAAVHTTLKTQGANSAVLGSPSNLSSDGQFNVSQVRQTTSTRGTAMDTTNKNAADESKQETCATQTDLSLDNDQREWTDTTLRETKRQQRVAGRCPETASSSETSLPVLLDYFGPRLTEYEERSIVEDFGADGMLTQRTTTERKYKLEPGEGRSIVKTEIG
ncbi:uncharacterized protein LOC121405852 isoform X1 [Lytechinus variegatus]|uniref:uncharacterized protein LOC121405852 isoform X1 n=1 Tax=Lytechinus variegatus TaxID=7654 RepID=UPI001BB28121|nr:uncharacterized protein LOC121405852 isoform X1 [Lytechinus variegatus]XP_041452760.1 uncharacterized protein LOC121405852 isoform X1 [Lytechinus variegatus]